MRLLHALHHAACGLLLCLPFASATSAHGMGATVDIRMYVLDCGHLAFKDMGMFDDSGASVYMEWLVA